MNQKLEIIRSDRKTVSVQVREDLRVLVRAPRRMSDRDIQAFLHKNAGWIDRHVADMKRRQAAAQQFPPFTQADLAELTRRAAAVIPARVSELARRVGVDYGRVTIRHQISRWGSCSSLANLNFNCLLVLAPAEVMDYVIIHELCHRVHMNHSPAFWALVEKHCPAYRKHRQWLRQEGEIIMRRLRAYA